MKELLRRLEAAAIDGQRAIENGDCWRHQLPDPVFSELVPAELEEAVIEEMVASERWWRGSSGFDLRDWRTG